MKKEQLNKIAGFIALGLLFGFIFLISWFFSKTNQRIEGPHIFYQGDTIKALSINITGNKQEKKVRIIEPIKTNEAQFKMKTPDRKTVFLGLHNKIETPKDHYEKADNVFVISDIEGDFDYLKEILQGNQVINQKYNWTYGQGHLMVVGDIFDRGKHVTECLWLLYKLEKEALAVGGRVHLILGNHEIMALQGDHRYLNRKYKKITRNLNLEYKDLYSSSTEIGKWLRSKNTIEIIGKTLFVHGGLSPQLADTKVTISQINNMVRKNIAPDNISNPDSTATIVMGKMGPLWYRGYIENPISDSDVESIIDFYNVDEIAVGHTVVDKITPFFNYKIYALDAKRNKNSYTALLIENSIHYTVTDKGIKTKL